jgi:hypothetical protein
VKLQVLNGCNCPRDAKLLALEGYAARDRDSRLQMLNGREVAPGDVFIDSAVLYSPHLAALNGDVHLGFFKMKLPTRRIGRITMPAKNFGRIRMPNVGRGISRFGRDSLKTFTAPGRQLAKAGGKFLSKAGQAFSQGFDSLAQASAPGEDSPPPDAQEQQQPQSFDQSTDYSQQVDDSQIQQEAALPVEDAEGNLLGFLPLLATAGAELLPSLLPAITGQSGGIGNLLQSVTKMLPGGAQGTVSQALPIAAQLRAKQLARKRQQAASRQAQLRSMQQRFAPGTPVLPSRPARQYQPAQQQRPVIVQQQTEVPAQRQQQEPVAREYSSDSKTTLYVIGAVAGTAALGGLAYAIAKAGRKK